MEDNDDDDDDENSIEFELTVADLEDDIVEEDFTDTGLSETNCRQK